MSLRILVSPVAVAHERVHYVQLYAHRTRSRLSFKDYREVLWLLFMLGLVGYFWVTKGATPALMIFGGVILVGLLFAFGSTRSYLRLDNGVLEYWWFWRRGSPKMQAVLKDIESVSIEEHVQMTGRYSRAFTALVLTPEHASDEVIMPMPTGRYEGNSKEFLQLIRKELRKS